MWKLIDANVRNARFVLNMVLLAGLIYAMVVTLKTGETPYINFYGD